MKQGLPEFHHLGVQWSRREWAARAGKVKPEEIKKVLTQIEK